MSRSRLFLILFGSLAFWLFGLPALAAGPSPKIKIFVSIVPQKYFVQKIGGTLVDAVAMVQPGNNPHHYEPKAQQMIELSHAKIYFAIGVPFENVWLPKLAAANPKMLVIHTEADVARIPMLEHDTHVALHAGEALDPHIWLSPRLVMAQARDILQGLIAVDPANAALFMNNYRSFMAELTVLDLELMEVFRQAPGKQFLVFHPSWGYFARDYGLTQIAIEVEGKEPKGAQLKKVLDLGKAQKIPVVFAQPEFAVKSAQYIAKEINAEVVFASPLSEEWEKNLKTIAAQFKAALR